MSLLKDETRAFTRSGHVFLKTPNKSLQPVVIAPETSALYWIRARIERSQYERPPKLLAIRTNTIAVRQAETVRDEVLGGSNGRRDQVFRLASAPVLRDTLRLEIDEGSGPEIWTRVDDFFGSGPADLHYMLNRTTGEIRFGDGLQRQYSGRQSGESRKATSSPASTASAAASRATSPPGRSRR